MATKDETPFRESLTGLTDLGLSPRHELFAGPCESLIFGESRRRTRIHLRGLTNCEQEVLDLVSDGQSNEVIAATLSFL
jgi:DNA-binding NarL/FixJ family response regulator